MKNIKQNTKKKKKKDKRYTKVYRRNEGYVFYKELKKKKKKKGKNEKYKLGGKKDLYIIFFRLTHYMIHVVVVSLCR